MASREVCKFRHVYGQAAKPDHQFLAIPSPLTSGEGTYVGASHKYFAFSGTSVRRLYLRKLDKPGRFSPNEAHIGPDCLKGKIWDFDFHPFYDNLLAMGDDNGKVCVVTIPDSCDEMGYLSENVSKATVDLGTIHTKKVILLTFHPCASNVLATGSFDRTVKLYNIENQKELTKVDGFGDTIYSVEWNDNGNLIGISSKDKTIRIVDPRTVGSGGNDQSGSKNTVIKKAFDGAKSTKLFWISKLNAIGATGFSKLARRQLKLWDIRMMSEQQGQGKPLISHTIDQASSVLMPRFDESNNLLYLAGKGDGTVSYGEFRNDNKVYHGLGVYRSPEPQRGGGWVPKRGLNVWKCEIERFLKLTRKSIIPVSFIVPRKAGADVFQSDIYPDAASGVASMTVDEWFEKGENKSLSVMSLDPEQRTDKDNANVKRAQLSQQHNPSPRTTRELRGNKPQLGLPSNGGEEKDSGIDSVRSQSSSVMERPFASSVLEKENSDLKKENAQLKEKIEQLEMALDKYVKEEQKEDMPIMSNAETGTESEDRKDTPNTTATANNTDAPATATATETRTETEVTETETTEPTDQAPNKGAESTEADKGTKEDAPAFAEKSVWEDESE